MSCFLIDMGLFRQWLEIQPCEGVEEEGEEMLISGTRASAFLMGKKLLIFYSVVWEEIILDQPCVRKWYPLIALTDLYLEYLLFPLLGHFIIY